MFKGHDRGGEGGVMTDINPETLAAAVAGLTVEEYQVIDGVIRPEGGYGPRHVAAYLSCSLTEARIILKGLVAKGICDYGYLMTDDGYLAGAGYSYDMFGEAVYQAVINAQCHGEPS